MKVSISDVVVTTREVDIPEACPKCDADFTDAEEQNVSAYEWQDQGRPGHFGEDGEFVYHEAALPDSGESYIAYIGYACSACGASLAEGTLETKDA
jgi:hypothetical protein